MAGSWEEWIDAFLHVALALCALYAACHLFKDHRAPAIGFFLIGVAASLSVMPFRSPTLTCVQQELRWAGEVLGPALVTFGFLWLSEDRLTAHMLLVFSVLLPGLYDRLSREGLVLMSRCLALSSLCCSLSVCLFTVNVAGVLGSVTLALPALVDPRVGAGVGALKTLVRPETEGVLLPWLLKGFMVMGCLSTKQALGRYLLDVRRLE